MAFKNNTDRECHRAGHQAGPSFQAGFVWEHSTGLSDAKYGREREREREREKLCVNEGEVNGLWSALWKAVIILLGKREREKKGILLKSWIFAMVLKSNRSFSHDTSVLNPYCRQIFFLKRAFYLIEFSRYILDEWYNLVSRSFCMREFYWLNKRQEDRWKREKRGREGEWERKREVGRKGKRKRDFSAGPVVKTPCLHCSGCRFDSWSGN